MIYTNPTLRLEIQDYPMGGSKRGTCVFEVEKNTKGERVIRTTTFNGRTNAPKKTTYANKVIIAEGADGKTYLLEDVSHYNFVSVRRWDFMQHENIHESDPRYKILMEFIHSI